MKERDQKANQNAVKSQEQNPLIAVGGFPQFSNQIVNKVLQTASFCVYSAITATIWTSSKHKQVPKEGNKENSLSY